jgi:uncharacterized membrane protein
MSQTQASATIEAPLADVNAVISDLSNYPSWSSAITAVKVIESDAQGRATKVELKVNSGRPSLCVTYNHFYSSDC